MTKVQLFDQHIKRMRVLVCIAVRDDDVPQRDVLERLNDRLVSSLLQRVGVAPHGPGKQVSVLGKPDEARADSLSWETVDRERVDCDGPVGEFYHAEEGEDEGGFAAVESQGSVCGKAFGGGLAFLFGLRWRLSRLA